MNLLLNTLSGIIIYSTNNAKIAKKEKKNFYSSYSYLNINILHSHHVKLSNYLLITSD